MNYGISTLSIIPIRTKETHKSEMVSQLLFGETYTILSIHNNWALIKCSFDGLEGYIHTSQIKEIAQGIFEEINATTNTYAFDLLSPAISNLDHIPLFIGSSLPFFDGLSFRLNRRKIVYNGQVINPNEQDVRLHIKKIALKYLNAPYLWGGRSPFGIDSSGLMQMIYKLLGLALPRQSREQASLGQTVPLIHSAVEGDIAFFENDMNDIIHTGMILDDQKVIHCYGKVRIDRIDSHGIYNAETQTYSHKLRAIKRII